MVTMSIFNLPGRLISRREVALHAGKNRFAWTPGTTAPDGIYLIRFRADNFRLQKKVLFLK